MEDLVLNGPEDTSGIPHLPIGKLLINAFSSFDNSTIAVIDDSGESLTYEQLCQRSKNLAASLRSLGVTKNDTIGLVAENSKEFLIGYLAAFFLGSPLHLIISKYTKYEMKHTLTLSEPVVVLCTKKTHHNVLEVVEDLDFVKILICLDDNLSKNSTCFQIEEEIDPKDHLALICNTSGTTGLPKAAMLTHEMIRWSFVYGRDPNVYNIGFGEAVPLILPFVHIYGVHIINAALFSGATIIAFDGFNPTKFLESIEKYKPEKLFVVPTVIDFFTKSPLVEKYDISSVKNVLSGGSLIPKEVLELFLQKLKLEKFCIGYGMTEVGVVLLSPINGNGSTGKVLSGYQLKIIDLTDGHKLSLLQTGELCFKGDIMKKYLKNPEETEKILDSEGFLHTGDVGHCDEDGYVYITGRVKEIIKYKSLLVSPVELEGILFKHKSIKDVAVVGKPDQRFGEVPTAFVVKEDGATVTENEICDYVAEFVNEDKRLYGGVRFVEVIPRNSLGKILRHQLIEQLQI